MPDAGRVIEAQRPKHRVVTLATRTPLNAGDALYIDAPQSKALAKQTKSDPKLRRIGGFWQVMKNARLKFSGT